MAGLLDFLGLGQQGQISRGPDGQNYQYAETTGMAGDSGGQGWIRTNQQPRGGMFSGRLGALNDPAIALPLAGALMQPGDIGSNLGQGFALAGQGVATRKKLQQEQLQQNMTAKYLEAQGADPALVELARSGAGGMALQQWNAMKPEKLDPLESLRARKLDLEIGQLENPQSLESDTQRRAREAEQFGLSKGDPAYQSYVLTGRMPREDQSPLTATDKKAILDADDAVAINSSALGTIDQALAINEKANAGAGAGTRAFLGNNLPDYLVPDAVSSPESSLATVEYDNLVQNQALQQLKSIFGAAPTEGERIILMELQASSNKKPEVRKKILERARALAERRLQFNQERAGQLRGGTFYKPQGGGIKPPAATSNGIQWSVEQ